MKRLAAMFRALSDESRLRIINLLVHSGELCVCDIQSIMGFTQTKVSRHLSYLKRAGLVNDRRKGLWMLYSIAKPTDQEQRLMLESLDRMVRENPVALKDHRRLKNNVRQGCCATFTIVKPNQEPIALKLN